MLRLYFLLLISICYSCGVVESNHTHTGTSNNLQQKNDLKLEQSKDEVKPKMNNQMDVESMKNQKLGKSTSIEDLKSKQSNNSKQKKSK